MRCSWVCRICITNVCLSRLNRFSRVKAYIYIVYLFISCYHGYISYTSAVFFLSTIGANRLGGETTSGAKRLEGAKRLGGKRLGGKRLGGETTRGGNGLGAKRPGFLRSTKCNVSRLGKTCSPTKGGLICSNVWVTSTRSLLFAHLSLHQDYYVATTYYICNCAPSKKIQVPYKCTSARASRGYNSETTASNIYVYKI